MSPKGSARQSSLLLFGFLVVIGLQAKAATSKSASGAEGNHPEDWLEWFWETSHWPISIFILILIILAIIYLVPLIAPRELVINFQDLRTALQAGDQKNKDIRDQAITELFMSDLRKVFSIHELAINYFEQRFRNQDISSSYSCADMTSIWSQIDITAITIQDPSQLALASRIFHEDLGEITTGTGSVSANIPISAVTNFFRSRKKDNILIKGSVQDQGNSLLLVAQILQGLNSWAWTLTPQSTPHTGTSKNLPHLIKDLSYHVANRIIGQRSQLIDVLPGDHFQEYTELLGQFVAYLQSDTHQKSGFTNETTSINDESYGKLRTAMDRFKNKEPFDLRTYYMTYIMGLLAISRDNYQDAFRYLSHSDKTEPFVVRAIVSAGLKQNKLNWAKEIFENPSLNRKRLKRVSKLDRVRAERLSIMLANVNSTLGFVIEQEWNNRKKKEIKKALGIRTHQRRQRSDIHFYSYQQINENMILEDIEGVHLEDAERAHHKASLYDPENPLFLSNRAEVLMKLADHQQPKEMHSELRLHYRTQAKYLLLQACEKSKHPNIKYSHLRSGHFALSRGDLKQAERCYRQALECDPSFIVAARNLASIYSMCGDYDKAIAVCDEALGIVGQKGSYYFTSKEMHGWIHNSRGWAYFLKARNRRHELDRQARARNQHSSNHPCEWKDTECESWLKTAEANLHRSYNLLKSSDAHTVPAFNLYLLYIESAFLGTLRSHDLSKAESILRDLSLDDPLWLIYSTVVRSSVSFKYLFDSLWRMHELVPTEYFGILGDILLILAYIQEFSISSSKMRKNILLQLMLPGQGSRRHPVGDEDQIKSEQSEGELLPAVQARLNKAVKIVEGLLPTCFLGVLYLWWNKQERAVECWQTRVSELESYFKRHNDIGTHTSTALNYSLWKYLYLGFICIFEKHRAYQQMSLLQNTHLSDALVQVKKTFGTYTNSTEVNLSTERDPRVTSSYKYACNVLQEVLDLYEIMRQRGPNVIGQLEKKHLDDLFQPIVELRNQIIPDWKQSPFRAFSRSLQIAKQRKAYSES